ncbi:sigma factor G inhibitor Gin [Paenibacillus eucommiae]|uniref:Inhibitor of sigma-G Gin n=1 Tax=Paenibacillus eucommiae TaxID=1355755 RepID=A0ABS4J8M7_9BACL|nr:sigma factor G inhibitor Gin [Paenibacillus eucommiae]MBP1996203.1 hypothetical protein [Paenibacillus eucommiae]
MEETQTDSCIICGQRHQKGILILAAFLCEDCELEIVGTDVHDVKYPYFVHQMGQVLYKKNA